MQETGLMQDLLIGLHSAHVVSSRKAQHANTGRVTGTQLFAVK